MSVEVEKVVLREHDVLILRAPNKAEALRTLEEVCKHHAKKGWRGIGVALGPGESIETLPEESVREVLAALKQRLATIPDQELDDLENLCLRATPGPWSWESDEDPPRPIKDDDPCREKVDGCLVAPVIPNVEPVILVGIDLRELPQADRAFLSRTRAALPRLLDEVRVLRVQVAQLEDLLIGVKDRGLADSSRPG